MPDPGSFDVVVVGTGFTGIYALHRCRQAGWSVLGIEAGDGVGGTWYWNRYPGARCDVESVDYSYSFDGALQASWRWSENYATQPEIRSYLEHATDRFGLRDLIVFGERVVAAHHDGDRWLLTTDAGRKVSARFVIMATGSLSAPQVPDLPGLADFAGEVVLTAMWPERQVSFAGRKVGVIGTGASALQLVPIVAGDAAELTVFQRTANYSIPVRVAPYSDQDQQQIQDDYSQRRAKSWRAAAGTPHESYPVSAHGLSVAEQREVLDASWQKGGVLFAKTFPDQNTDISVNDLARAYVEEQIRSIVKDPSVAADLVPVDHPIGAKRICSDLGYYDVFNHDHVRLVNLRREPIKEVNPRAIVTADREIELDLLIFATGFDAMTGPLTRIELTGPRGDTITNLWRHGPLTYLGVAVPGMPNLFVLNGAGTPSVLANMALSAEQQVNWTIDLIAYCVAHGIDEVEPRADAARKWTDHVTLVGEKTFMAKVNSWYVGANIEGKPRAFLPYAGGFAAYTQTCEAVAERGYDGFVLTRRSRTA
jgi:cation diffusion facilitator CzcD-associated flavoprotein CzcO